MNNGNTVEQSNNGSNRVEAPQPKFSALSLVVMSALLEYNGQAPELILYQQLKAEGVSQARVAGCITKTLLKRNMVQSQDGNITILTDGLDYVASHIDRIEEAEQKVLKPKRFAPTVYRILNTLKEEAHDDGWLLGSSNASAVERLAEHIGSAPSVATRRLYDCRQAGFVEQQTAVLPERRGRTITNLRLTETGQTELATIRENFAAEIAKLEEPEETDIDPQKIAIDELLLTAQAMSEEINHMHEELGEPPEDFADVTGYNETELRTLAGKLSSTMKELEKRLNDPQQSRPSTPLAAVS